MLPEIRDYDRLYAAFRWQIPERYNIGVDACDRWAAADPSRLAIIDVGPDGKVVPVSFAELRDASNRLANALRARGIGRGDRVAILLAQSREAAIAHIAIYKLGAVALPWPPCSAPRRSASGSPMRARSGWSPMARAWTRSLRCGQACRSFGSC